MLGKVSSSHPDGSPKVTIWETHDIREVMRIMAESSEKLNIQSQENINKPGITIGNNIHVLVSQNDQNLINIIETCEFRGPEIADSPESTCSGVRWECKLKQGREPLKDIVNRDRCFHCVLGHLPVKHPSLNKEAIESISIEKKASTPNGISSDRLSALIDSCPNRGEITAPNTCKSCELRKCLLGYSKSEETPGQVDRKTCAICTIETYSLQDEFPGYNQGGPGIFSKAANFAKALGKHVTNGMVHVSPEQKQARLDKCRACPYLQTNLTCAHPKCGCPVLAKTEWESESCPIGEW